MTVREDGIAAKRGRAPTDASLVVDAAIKCFSRFGPQRTSMKDIADAAKISRKTLYRTFDDRMDLVSAVIVRLLDEISEDVSQGIKPNRDPKSAIIDGLVLLVELIERNTLLSDTIASETNQQVEQLLVGKPEFTRSFVNQVWEPAIHKARQEGLLRSTLSNQRVYEIKLSLVASLLMRRGRKTQEQRQFLDDMLVVLFED